MVRHLAPALVAVMAGLAGPRLVAGAEEGKPELVALKLQLPKPMFIGTPAVLKAANLEKPSKEKRPDPLVPVGASNVALKKPVTASDTQPVMGDLSQVTDGDKDGIEGSYVEIGPGKQHFQVDLKETYRIYVIVLWHYHNQPRVYRDVVVQLADDADFAVNVRTVFNNDHDNSSGLGIGADYEYVDSHEGRLIDAQGAPARYVRLYSNGNTDNSLNHCTEVEIYGRK